MSGPDSAQLRARETFGAPRTGQFPDQDVTCSLGTDPGGTSGLFLGAWRPGERKPFHTRAWQCDMAATPELLSWILRDYKPVLGAAGFESFDARERSRKMRGFSASAMHTLIAGLEAQVRGAGIPVVTYPPARVKTWATDKRLEAAGLLAATAGMPAHARDGARICLFTACHDLGLRDPLSRKAA